MMIEIQIMVLMLLLTKMKKKMMMMVTMTMMMRGRGDTGVPYDEQLYDDDDDVEDDDGMDVLYEEHDCDDAHVVVFGEHVRYQLPPPTPTHPRSPTQTWGTHPKSMSCVRQHCVPD